MYALPPGQPNSLSHASIRTNSHRWAPTCCETARPRPSRLNVLINLTPSSPIHPINISDAP